MSKNLRPVAVLLLSIVIGLTLGGCRNSAQPTATPNVALKITLDAASLKVGETSLTVTVLDAAGSPINNAKVEVRGDMSHAGMVPSFGGAEQGESGRYIIPFQWTMGGDWVVTVSVTLPDGRSASERFELVIHSQ